jgi:hypothetical protein
MRCDKRRTSIDVQRTVSAGAKPTARRALRKKLIQAEGQLVLERIGAQSIRTQAVIGRAVANLLLCLTQSSIGILRCRNIYFVLTKSLRFTLCNCSVANGVLNLRCAVTIVGDAQWLNGQHLS